MATENSSLPAPKASLSSAVKVRKTPVKAGPLPAVPQVKVITPMGWMHTARFLTTAAELFHLPALDVPEIAFVGRSNAGKSTCINTLTQQKQLAFASKKPGRTQHINLFSLGKQGSQTPFWPTYQVMATQRCPNKTNCAGKKSWPIIWSQEKTSKASSCCATPDWA